VGRVVFAPWFENEVLGDDNLFRRRSVHDVNVDPQDEFPGPGDFDSNSNGRFDPPVVSDVETTVSAGVTAYIPFRMSSLQFAYEGDAYFYRDSSVENADTHTGSVQLALNSSNRDEFVFGGSYEQGITQRLTIEQENEFDIDVIEGIPLVRNDWSFSWSRTAPRKPSWEAQLDWVDLRYEPDPDDPDSTPSWVDYTGWSLRSEYLQPFYGKGYFTAVYSGRRHDQFETRALSVTDELLRRENYDALELGYRGLVGRNQPLYLALGYAKLNYKETTTITEPTNFSGAVGSLTWRIPVGGVTNMSVSANRRPTSSLSYNTYYLINELRVRFDRPLAEISRYGVSALLSNNRYGAILDEVLVGDRGVEACDVDGFEVIRKDRRNQIEGFWEWFIQPRMALRMTAGHSRRDVNCDSDVGSYVSNTVGVSFKLGWFD